MTDTARFLHITDSHLNPAGGDFMRDDRGKVNNLHLEPQSRALAIGATLERFAERLTDKGLGLAGVIFSGDALSAGQAGGDKLLLELILQHLGPVGIDPSRIVAVPGNHDVPRGASPDSAERYADFIRVWRDGQCITPWLDGIDTGKTDFSKHILVGPANAWALIALNSCNWSHVDAISPELAAAWESIPALLAPSDTKLQVAFSKELSKLARYDMARVSPAQMAALRTMLRAVPRAVRGEQLRMMVMHHHLRSPTHAEEVKPFADVVNLEQVRSFIAQQRIRVVFHGHKHAGRIHSDFIENGAGRPHELLMVAGASFSATDHADAMRLLELSGLPWLPTLTVESLPVPRDGLTVEAGGVTTARLWSPTDDSPEVPVVIQGSDFDEVYARVTVAAHEEAQGRTLIVQLDLNDFSAVKRLPYGYPTDLTDLADTSARQSWLRQLVEWWQLPQSQLQERVPYIHGTRLHRYANYLDQVGRVRTLLAEGQTTRAIAVLIDPAIDFKESGPVKNDFASFCLVQFSRRDEAGGQKFVDCVGYYRAQEMVKWWPINVAELLELQTQVGLAFGATPGRITTMTASARSLAKSPTHVAMPVIDRWLDQAPEKYFVLASALLSDAPPSEQAKQVLREWGDALEALQVAAVATMQDGGPVVAIEGPARLAKYLAAGTGPRAEECRRLANTLDEIARMGTEAPPTTEVTRRADWGRRLAAKLAEVAATSKAREA